MAVTELGIATVVKRLLLKACRPMVVTELGITIAIRRLRANA